MAARLVPWTICGLSLVVLGLLVVLNPYLEPPAAAIGGTQGEASDSPPWIIGAILIGLGASAAIIATWREAHGH